MNKTAVIAFPVTVFLAWMLYVITRAGNGPGLKWNMVPNNLSFTFTMVGVIYVIFVLITSTVLYFTHVRGTAVGAISILGPAFLRLLLVFVVAVPVGSTLAECFTYADERAFAGETQKFMATAKPEPIAGDMPLYSRKRWWPGSQQQLVSAPSK